jgi:hypothetical protein
MRALLFLLLLFTSSFASADFGYSRISLERTWTIENGAGSSIDFTGTLVVNNSNQHVISVTTDPGVVVQTDDDGVVTLHYDGPVDSDRFLINGKAVVEVDYDTNLTFDPPLPDNNPTFTNLTMPDSAISNEARLLSHRSSSLKTIEDMTNWVHSNVEYDVTRWGESNPAQVVFKERRGVCVEFAHLLISMLRSSGLDTRYVSGYVYSDIWQAHAWVEVYLPGYGWLPVDATFAQAGILDSSHVAMNFAEDQSAPLDILLSTDSDITMDVQNTITTQFSLEDPKGASLDLDFDHETYVVSASIDNERPDYLFGTYSIQLPDGYGEPSSSLLLLSPDEELTRYYGMNHSLFEDGYLYTVPVEASFNDAKDKMQIKVDGSNGLVDLQPPPCPFAFLLLSLLFGKAFF